MELIYKSALVAEIERRIERYSKLKGNGKTEIGRIFGMLFEELTELLSFLDTLEVKEVDLEKELDSFAYSLPHSAIGNGSRLGHFDDPRVIEARDGGWTHSWKYDEIKKIAKHFFELGLKAQKGE